VETDEILHVERGLQKLTSCSRAFCPIIAFGIPFGVVDPKVLIHVKNPSPRRPARKVTTFLSSASRIDEPNQHTKKFKITARDKVLFRGQRECSTADIEGQIVCWQIREHAKSAIWIYNNTSDRIERTKHLRRKDDECGSLCSLTVRNVRHIDTKVDETYSIENSRKFPFKRMRPEENGRHINSPERTVRGHLGARNPRNVSIELCLIETSKRELAVNIVRILSIHISNILVENTWWDV
jgi:hypothetical protein